MRLLPAVGGRRVPPFTWGGVAVLPLSMEEDMVGLSSGPTRLSDDDSVDGCGKAGGERRNSIQTQRRMGVKYARTVLVGDEVW